MGTSEKRPQLGAERWAVIPMRHAGGVALRPTWPVSPRSWPADEKMPLIGGRGLGPPLSPGLSHDFGERRNLLSATLQVPKSRPDAGLNDLPRSVHYWTDNAIFSASIGC